METFLVIALPIALFLLILSAGFNVALKGDIKAQQVSIESEKEFSERLRDANAIIVANLKSQLATERKRAEALGNRVDELTRQNQNLAERVASLRLSSDDVVGGDDFHVEDATPSEPYSPDLQEFYSGLTVDVQHMAESFIADGRSRGLDDEQILRQLEEEWSE